VIAEARELTGGFRGEIDHPEIQRRDERLVHQSRSVGQEAIAARAGSHRRQPDRGAIRSHPKELDLAGEKLSCIHNQIPVRRPDGIDGLTGD